jgi:hypothetical protein
LLFKVFGDRLGGDLSSSFDLAQFLCLFKFFIFDLGPKLNPTIFVDYFFCKHYELTIAAK